MATAKENKPGAEMKHKDMVHTHDHWHVTHYHTGQGPNDFEHRSTYHTHEHNHAGYDYQADMPGEHTEQHHAAKAHVHDHNTPTEQG